VEREATIAAQTREDVLGELIIVVDKDSDAFIDQYQSHNYRLRVKAFIKSLRNPKNSPEIEEACAEPRI
jgi:hypothetical protein